jgi:hypothetical protein
MRVSGQKCPESRTSARVLIWFDLGAVRGTGYTVAKAKRVEVELKRFALSSETTAED